MQADVKLNFEVNRISINRNGSALLLVGSDRLCVMYLYGRTCRSDNKTIICRSISCVIVLWCVKFSRYLTVIDSQWVVC